MMVFLRGPLVCIAVLATYLVVNVGAAALHHHPGAETRPGGLPVASDGSPQCQTCAATDDEGEDHCQLCSVLHLARILPTPCHAEGSTILPEEVFPSPAAKPLDPLKTAPHARGPPLR